MNTSKLCSMLGSLLAFLLFQSQANAVPLNYILEGDLSLSSGTDQFEVSGAHFVWRIQADTDAAPTNTSQLGSTTPPGTRAAYGPALGGSIALTNRPSGRSNIVSDVFAFSQAYTYGLATENYPSLPLAPLDRLILPISKIDVFPLIIGGVGVSLPRTFFAGSDAAPLPELFNSTQVISIAPGLFRTDDSSIMYSQHNLSLSVVSSVPEPAATWLMGCGLIVLICLDLAKRGQRRIKFTSLDFHGVTFA